MSTQANLFGCLHPSKSVVLEEVSQSGGPWLTVAVHSDCNTCGAELEGPPDPQLLAELLAIPDVRDQPKRRK